jgi:hypothetical protein
MGLIPQTQQNPASRWETFASEEFLAQTGPPNCEPDKGAAYFRAAQAYMLISMPTGISTILGVFQAIFGLLTRCDGGSAPSSTSKLSRSFRMMSSNF